MFARTLVVSVLFLFGWTSAAQPPLTRDDVVRDVMHPFSGESVAGVDTSTLTGKVMCGYQGWFTCEGDAAGRGWFHWGRGGNFRPGACSIDLWPDMTELGEDERFETQFRHADGSMAPVFSSMNEKTVVRHFEWMRDYGIDGAFVQRFAGETMHPHGLRHSSTVLTHCRKGANLYGRAYAVMYDLSGMQAGQMERVMDDWKRLVDKMGIAKDPADKAYLHHNGRPVVSVWGVGFNDNRKYTLAECAQLIDVLKNDPRYGGCTVMLGVPSYWRTQTRDCVPDPALHDVLLGADIISPWTPGRYRSPKGAARHAGETWKPDLEWCRERGKEFLPVVFPGFSWHNLKPTKKLDQIPRLGGRFLWSQYVGALDAGATMVYQAMFDEVDEGTAIFKCTNDPPVGASPFLTYEGLPSDHYLWLVGQGARMMRGERSRTTQLPKRVD